MSSSSATYDWYNAVWGKLIFQASPTNCLTLNTTNGQYFVQPISNTNDDNQYFQLSNAGSNTNGHYGNLICKATPTSVAGIPSVAAANNNLITNSATIDTLPSSSTVQLWQFQITTTAMAQTPVPIVTSGGATSNPPVFQIVNVNYPSECFNIKGIADYTAGTNAAIYFGLNFSGSTQQFFYFQPLCNTTSNSLLVACPNVANRQTYCGANTGVAACAAYLPSSTATKTSTATSTPTSTGTSTGPSTGTSSGSNNTFVWFGAGFVILVAAVVGFFVYRGRQQQPDTQE